MTVTGMAVAAVVSQEYDFKDTLLRWDSGWYLKVAADGYPHEVPTIDGHAAQSTIAFFPLFPLCVRTLSTTTGLSLEAAGLVCATGFGALAAMLLWLLVRRITDAETADRATALFCFFPGSFVLSMPYSEPLMLLLALACLHALLSRRWLLAGTAAGLATATRPNAAALVACCLWASAGALRHREWRALAAPVLAPAGLFAFVAFLWVRTGKATAWLDVQQQGWGERFDFGGGSWHKLVQAARDPLGDVNQLVATLGLVFILAVGTLLLRSRLPSVVVVYAAVIVALAVGSQTLGARPRFVLTAFPLFIALAMRVRGLAFAVALGSSAALLGVLTVLSTGTLVATP